MRIESDCMNLQFIDQEEEGRVEASINGSDDLRSVQEMQEDQNICKFSESSVILSASTRKVYKSVNKGFNLRKSLAWNPAFFTEEGVLEPAELSYINGSNGLQKTGERSVLNEVLNNSCEKNSNQNSQLRFQNGRKLFCTPESSKRGARSINSRLPRPPLSNSQKRVANTNATGHIPKAPKFVAGNGNITPNTKNSNISINTPTIKKEQSNIKKPTALPPKPSNRIISKTVTKPPVQPSASSNMNKNDNNSNSVNKNENNENVGPTARILMKPSALRMPSPSLSFFSRGKVSPQPSNSSQNNTDNNKTLNSSTKPPNPNSLRRPVIPPPSARCQTPIGPIVSKLNTPTSSKLQIGPKNTQQIIPKYDRLVNYTSKKEQKGPIGVLKREKRFSTGKIRVCEEAKEEMCFSGKIRVSEEAKEETCSIGKIRVCEETKEETCSIGKIRVCEETKEETCSDDKIRVCEEPKEETCSNGEIRVCEEPKEEIFSNGEIRVCEEPKEETCSNGSSNGKIRVSEEPKEDYSVKAQPKNESIPSETCTESKSTLTESKSTLTESKSNSDKNPTEDLNEEKFTHQIPCNLENSSIDKQQKLKRKSSVYRVSPLKNNKRDKTVFSPYKLKPLEIEKSKTGFEKSEAEIEKSKEDMCIEEKKKADCLTKCRKDLVPFSDEWFAALETFGEEILEQKTGPVQHSPPDKTVPEPSPWSPVKRKAQDIGPYDCTKYFKQ